MTDWPHIELSGVAINRGSASDAPPGLKGTIILTSLLGKGVCALADDAAAAKASPVAIVKISLKKQTAIRTPRLGIFDACNTHSKFVKVSSSYQCAVPQIRCTTRIVILDEPQDRHSGRASTGEIQNPFLTSTWILDRVQDDIVMSR
jgi:hypothetical protein